MRVMHGRPTHGVRGVGKRVIGTLGAVALTASLLSACGGGDEQPSADAGATSSTPTPEESTPSAEPGAGEPGTDEPGTSSPSPEASDDGADEGAGNEDDANGGGADEPSGEPSDGAGDDEQSGDGSSQGDSSGDKNDGKGNGGDQKEDEPEEPDYIEFGEVSDRVGDLQQRLQDLGYFVTEVDDANGGGADEPSGEPSDGAGDDEQSGDGSSQGDSSGDKNDGKGNGGDQEDEPEEPDYIEFGEVSDRVGDLQQRLQDLGYFVTEVDDAYGGETQQAVFALQKAGGLYRDGVVGDATRAAADDGVVPQAQTSSGKVIEIDIDRQLVLAVEDGQVVKVINASSGNGETYEAKGNTYTAYTPRGSFAVYREENRTYSSSLELGDMWRPKFFTGGIALHGSSSVPAFPASHGCVRVSNSAMDWIWDTWGAPSGTPVVVY